MDVIALVARTKPTLASYTTIAPAVREFVTTFQNVFNFSEHAISPKEMTTMMQNISDFVCEYSHQNPAQVSEDGELVQFLCDLFSSIKILTRTYILEALSPLYTPQFVAAVISVSSVGACSVEVGKLRLEALRVLQNLTILGTAKATQAVHTQHTEVAPSSSTLFQLVCILTRGLPDFKTASTAIIDSSAQAILAAARTLTFLVSSSQLRQSLLSFGLVPAILYSFLYITSIPSQSVDTSVGTTSPKHDAHESITTEDQALLVLDIHPVSPGVLANLSPAQLPAIPPTTAILTACELLRLLRVCCAACPAAANLLSYKFPVAGATAVEEDVEARGGRVDAVTLSDVTVTFTENNVALSEVVLFTLLHAFMKRASAVLGLGMQMDDVQANDSHIDSTDAVDPPADSVAQSVAALLASGLASGAVVSVSGTPLRVDVATELSDAAIAASVVVAEDALPCAQDAPPASLLALKAALLAVIPYHSFAPATSPAVPAASPALPLLLSPACLSYLLRAFTAVIDALVPPIDRTTSEAPTCALSFDQQVMLLLPPVQTLLSALRATQAIRAAVRMFIFGAVGASDPQRAQVAAEERVMVPAGGQSEHLLDGVHNKSFRARVLISMLHPNSDLALMLQEIVYLACEEDTQEYIRLCGFGRAVGLLANKGLPGFTHLRENAVDLDDFVREYERSQ